MANTNFNNNKVDINLLPAKLYFFNFIQFNSILLYLTFRTTIKYFQKNIIWGHKIRIIITTRGHKKMYSCVIEFLSKQKRRILKKYKILNWFWFWSCCLCDHMEEKRRLG